jgi:tRNA 2-selenouridine synthase
LFNEISASDYLNGREGFSATLDARSPGEYAASNIPKAINFCAMTDEERADIGRLYARTPFAARALGASYICKNLAERLNGLEKLFTPADRLAIYCARGGMRSSSIAVVLAHIGYRIWRIRGGFKAYRNEILRYFANLPPFRFIALDGPTGSGKSDLIRALSWSVDLEALANHKGSAFGEIAGAQPKTAKFENELQYELARFAPAAPVAIEAESKSIGRVIVPPKLHDAIQKGLRVYIETPMEDRVDRVVREYGAIDLAFFDAAAARIAPHIPRKALTAAREAFIGRDLRKCAYLLLSEYYDKVYRKAERYDAIVKFDNMQNALAQLETIRERFGAR